MLPPTMGWRMRAGSAAIALACFSLVAALVAGELIVRVAAPQQLILIRPDLWRPADTLGWVQQANVDTRVNTGERTVRFLTDGHGFRVGHAHQSQAQRKILLLGDSYMAAMQVEYEQSVAGLIETDLSVALRTPVVVHNAGVGAWDVSHYLMQARRQLPKDEYDLVLVAVYLGNDLVRERNDYFPPRAPVRRAALRLPRALSSSEMVEAFARPVNDFLEQRSHLFILFKNTLQAVLMRMGLTARYIPEEIQRANAGLTAWEVSAAILGDIAALAEERAIPALFVLIPSNYQVDPGLLRADAEAMGFDVSTLDPEQPNRLLGERLKAQGLHVIDLLQALRDAHGQGLHLYGAVDPHFTPDGHRIMWETVKPDVLEILRDRRSHELGSFLGAPPAADRNHRPAARDSANDL